MTKKHILLIENDRDGYLQFMDVLKATLLDCKVTYTPDRNHALQMLEFLVPDCIFIRIDHQGQEVLDFIGKIREQKSIAHAIIVVYHDEVVTRFIHQAIRRGADYCIDKPRGLAEFSFLLKDVLNLNSRAVQY